MSIRGFTLLELCIVLALITVLSLISIISLNSFTQKNELKTITDEIKLAIRYSKNQAVLLSHPLYLEPLSADNNWSSGMSLVQFNKQTRDKELLYQWHWPHRHWEVEWKGATSSTKITLSDNPVHAISNGKFILMNIHSQEQKIMILNRIGRIREAKTG